MGHRAPLHRGGGQITGRQELASIDRPLVYLAFNETFSVENLRAMANAVAPQFMARMLGELELMDHRDGWFWRDPGIRFEPLRRLPGRIAGLFGTGKAAHPSDC